MPKIHLNNRGNSHLSLAIGAFETELRIPWADFVDFTNPDAIAGDTLWAVLRDAVDREIVSIDLAGSQTGQNDAYLKVTRAQGGTNAKAWPEGTLIFLSTHADHYGALFQPDGTRQIDFNPNGALSPNYAGEKVLQYAGCAVRWWMSFDAVNPYWALIAGPICPDEVYRDFGAGWGTWGYPDILNYITKAYGRAKPYDVWWDGNFLSTANSSTNGFTVYSVDEFGVLHGIDSHWPGGTYVGVWGDGTFIYCCVAGAGLKTYSLNALGHITPLDTIYTGGSYRKVWGDGTFIYTACANGGVKSHSVDGSGNLTQLDNFTLGAGDSSTQYDDVWGDGTFLYCACDLGGIRVLTVDGGGQFNYIGTLGAGTYRVNQLWGDGTFLYSCGSSAYNPVRPGGLFVYSVDGGGALTLLDAMTFHPITMATGLWGNGRYIFASAYTAGLYMFSVNGSGIISLRDTDVQPAGQGAQYRGIGGDGTYIFVADSRDIYGGTRSYSVI